MQRIMPPNMPPYNDSIAQRLSNPMFDPTNQWFKFNGSIIQPFYGSSMVQWLNDSMVPKFNDSLVQWFNGSNGPMVQWVSG